MIVAHVKFKYYAKITVCQSLLSPSSVWCPLTVHIYLSNPTPESYKFV